MLEDYPQVIESLSEELPASSTQRVYRQLRDKILIGDISPGERLKVENLKSSLDSGATPIREALSLLTSDQLVERIDQRGFRAAPANKSNFEEIFNLRCQLESMALRTSIEKGSEAWEESLILAHHRLSRVKETGTENFEKHHKMFHMTLLSACDSAILMGYCSQLYDLNIRYRHLAGQIKSYSTRNVAGEHERILKATLDRDADAACEALLSHYKNTGDLLVGLFDQ